ncbi:AraC family transcriptional regulator [Blastochloris tepida]|jgi:AraC-like DNA-binding protein|uniref:AraC family transcriptional regulator n=1 Tax=Blastochloris tepida TaxID=2233851 RepID=A0A348FXJ7_9HYPH|nr:AraC family transcriptional regulator [Blastochloris tepida]BBF92030.1 AraC family transcriptional regulator [Blastochloris tepida]
MDPLSDVLRSVRLTGGIFLDSRFTAPWCVTAKITAEDYLSFLSSASQVIAYHVVFEGRLLLSVECEPPLVVNAGEVVLLPRNDLHTLASAAGLEPVSARDLIQVSPDGGLARIFHGGGGDATRLVCGFLGSEETSNPLIATLPRVLKLDLHQVSSWDWIEASVRFAAGELAAGKLPTSSVLSRLSELLFVEAVRHYSSTHTDHDLGWLRGLRDPYVGRALAIIHRDIRAPWSVEALAKAVALSRSAFVERFTALVGVPPIRYLTVCRLQAAKQHLRDSAKTVCQLAHAVGYESEEAFSRAFKREFGLSPVQWRDRG